MTTKDKVNKAFLELRKIGYFAEQNFSCCQNCGWAEVPEDAEKVVFYHAQDNEAWNGDGELDHDLYLAWSGDANEIMSCFEGVNMNWDGNEHTRIKILAMKGV